MDWQDMVFGSGFILGGLWGYSHSLRVKYKGMNYTKPRLCSHLSLIFLTFLIVTLFALPPVGEWFAYLFGSLALGSIAGYLYADVME